MDPATLAVVDTDVVSFLFKSHPLASLYQAVLAGRPLASSIFTLAEIESGMEAKNWGASRRDLMRRFLARADAWIAATALQLNIPLATHNSPPRPSPPSR